MTYLKALGGLLMTWVSQLVLQGLYLILGGLIALILLAVGSLKATVDRDSRSDLFEYVRLMLEKWGGSG
mgnify:CR=1 FL=1